MNSNHNLQNNDYPSIPTAHDLMPSDVLLKYI